MITIVYDRQRMLVTIKGHSESAEKGQDIICAGVSAITYTLANAVENMKATGQLSARHIKLEEGDAVIRFVPKRAYKAMTRLVSDAICAGYELIAMQYKNNVSYEMRN